ncbi:hypothetical protein LTR94_032319, partial [Friedmanniomyces endolithicus]
HRRDRQGAGAVRLFRAQFLRRDDAQRRRRPGLGPRRAAARRAGAGDADDAGRPGRRPGADAGRLLDPVSGGQAPSADGRPARRAPEPEAADDQIPRRHHAGAGDAAHRRLRHRDREAEGLRLGAADRRDAERRGGRQRFSAGARSAAAAAGDHAEAAGRPGDAAVRQPRGR